MLSNYQDAVLVLVQPRTLGWENVTGKCLSYSFLGPVAFYANERDSFLFVLLSFAIMGSKCLQCNIISICSCDTNCQKLQ